MLANKQMTLIHLSTLIASRNGLREEEWSNYEFYPCLQTYFLGPHSQHEMKKGGILRPLDFRISLDQVCSIVSPEVPIPHLELIYRKRIIP